MVSPSVYRHMLVLSIALTCLLFVGTFFPISAYPQIADNPSQTYLPQVINQATTRFAVIGDYGFASQATQEVAALVSAWQPDYILTTGDNNYPAGEAATIDHSIGAYYHQYIAPYYGQYGAGSATNRFFPTLGNHDWESGGQAYLDYFTLPGNERYYDMVLGPVHLFALDSDPHEPDGVSVDSVQAQWLQTALAGSAACWNIVYMHHPPFSSGAHGSTPWMQWPYREWGADVVLGGHDHTYERIQHGDMLYFVNGLGGRSQYSFGALVEGSQVRYNADFGAMLIEINEAQAVFWFVTRTGAVIDTYEMPKDCSS